MSVSKQYAQIGVPPRTNKKRKAQTETQVVTVTKKSRSPVGAQIPRGFVTPLAMDSKFFDPAANTTVTLATGGNVTHLDVVTRGDAVNQRNGKTWQNINIQFRGRVFAGVQALLNHVAIYLIWDRQPNKALATVADILADPAKETTAFMNRENKARFVTIKKWQRMLIGNTQAYGVGVSYSGREAFVIDKWIKLPEECVANASVSDTTGAIGNRTTGALLLLTLGDKPAGNTAASLLYNYRIGFKDPQ